MLIAGIVWVCWVALYGLKWLLHTNPAIAEVAHPVQRCFIPLAGLSTMLMAGAVLPHAQVPGEILFGLGAASGIGFGVWRTGALWRGERESWTTTAVLYLPTVGGCFVAAIIASAIGYFDWAQLAFGAGLFSWIAIDSVLLHRMLTGPQLVEALRPTRGIQLAPAPVAALAYLSAVPTGPIVIAHLLLGYGLLQGFILLRMAKWIKKSAAPASFWGFTFGGTAIATAPLRLVARGDTGAISDLAPVLFVVANILVFGVAILTVRAAFKRSLFPPPNLMGANEGTLWKCPKNPYPMARQ